MPIEEQVRRTIATSDRLKAFSRLLVYFQPYSNSYAPPERLERIYRSAFSHPDVAGIIVGTRPDCLDPAALDVLEAISREKYVSIEIGLQSVSDTVLAGINRGHTVNDFADAAAAVRKRGIDVAAHLIYGLPEDTRNGFTSAAEFLSGIGVQGVKLHHFHVVSGSRLEDPWKNGEVPVPEYADYVCACADFLERLSPDVAVLRLIGSAPRDLLLAPLWNKGSRDMSRDVTAELTRRNTWQGSARRGGT